MKINKKLSYNLKRLVLMAGITGMTMLPVSCCKHDIQEETPPPVVSEPIEQHPITIEFRHMNMVTVLDIDTLQKYINDETIDTIYLVPTHHWNHLSSLGISKLRYNFFQPRMELSPKLHGRGDFDFHLGEASWVPTDSLWFIKNGWTINKDYQK